MANPTTTTNPPVSRQQVERHIDALIDLLDTLDTDPDLEPDLADSGTDREGDDSDYEPGTDDEPTLGWRGANCFPENDDQGSRFFHLNADSGREREGEHDGCEPDVDGEASLGWTDNPNQSSASWSANHLGTTDLEDSVGPVKKRRAPSKTGGNVYRGCDVLT